MKGKKNRLNKFKLGIVTSFCTLLSIYIVFALNMKSVSAKVTRENGSPETYTLTLHERGGINEQINGSDISLKYSSDNPGTVTYDENLLKDCVNKLSCFDSSKIIESQNPKIEYKDNGYTITKEIYGNRINKDVLYKNVVKAISNGDTTVNLDSNNCYENSKYVAN